MNAAAVEIIAHRGFSAKAPENTIAAFELAWTSGADACELDIHLTADGEVVVIHDKDTKRTFPGENKVIAQSKLAELPGISTLTETLATMPTDRGRFVIEIKTGAEIVPALVKVLEPLQLRAKQLVIISFQREACIAAKKALPWIPVLQLSGSKDKKTKQPIELADVITKAKADVGQPDPFQCFVARHASQFGSGWIGVDAEASVVAGFGQSDVATRQPDRQRKVQDADDFGELTSQLGSG
jgi:glycerophosphoryl diester phosphodiesterase